MTPAPTHVAPYDALRRPFSLRRHQAEALDAVRRAEADGSTRWWVTMPPGAGKTLVGTETARRTGRRTVVFSPNTAIQGQWCDAWDGYGTDAATAAGTSRDLSAVFTALTYQSLAVFDRDTDDDAADETEATDDADPADDPTDDPAEPDDGGPDPGSPLARLHPNGLALVRQLRHAGPLLIVLDECHHLLEVWGELLRAVLETLPDALVLGLTATPPAAMSRSQARLTDELFGPVLYEARIPALVREGVLAPYAELAWLTEPTADERDWLRGQSVRFAALTADLFDPEFGSTSFPVWLAQRFVEPVRQPGGSTTWDALSLQEPEVSDAFLRLVHADRATLPDGARLREPHRHDPSAEDWIMLLEDWIQGCVLPAAAHEHDGGQDTAVLEAVRRTLPSIGYVLTRNGIRKGRPTADRVVARSAAKQQGVAAILTEEAGNLGDEARVLVLCDHERATATSRRRLTDPDDAVPEPSGSALGVLHAVLADPTTTLLDPLLVTGRTVAGAPKTLARLRDHVAGTDPALARRLVIDDDRLTGPWRSGTWVRHATSFFAAGGSRCLIGTRGLLGEGWDAPAITSLVDLTTVTTATAVVQTRGRALRVDPERPDKVALIWSVVCVSDEHVAGGNDWDRFARKHVGYFTADETGEVTDGVAGIDSRFGPYQPPPTRSFDHVDADMLRRAGDRDLVRRAWRLRGAYADTVRQVLRVFPDRAPAVPAPVPEVELLDVSALAWANRRRLPVPTGRIGLALLPAVALLLLVLTPVPVLLTLATAVAATIAGLTAALASYGRAELAWESRQSIRLEHVALAVADALESTGRSTIGSSGVRVHTRPDGSQVFDLAGATEPASEAFSDALEELTAPLDRPRFVVPTPVTLAPEAPGLRRRLRAATASGYSPDAETWLAVPSALSGRRADREAYLAAWSTWVGGTRMLATDTPEGAGILTAQRYHDPFSVSSVVRRVWS